MYDPKQKHQKLHTSERTIVPRTVIFYFCLSTNIIEHCACFSMPGSVTEDNSTGQVTMRGFIWIWIYGHGYGYGTRIACRRVVFKHFQSGRKVLLQLSPVSILRRADIDCISSSERQALILHCRFNPDNCKAHPHFSTGENETKQLARIHGWSMKFIVYEVLLIDSVWFVWDPLLVFYYL